MLNIRSTSSYGARHGCAAPDWAEPRPTLIARPFRIGSGRRERSSPDRHWRNGCTRISGSTMPGAMQRSAVAFLRFGHWSARGVLLEVGRLRGLSLELESDAVHREIGHGPMAAEHPRSAASLLSCGIGTWLARRRGDSGPGAGPPDRLRRSDAPDASSPGGRAFTVSDPAGSIAPDIVTLLNSRAANWHKNQSQVAVVKVRHRPIAWLRNGREVLREILWRRTLKVLQTVARAERNSGADRADLNRCIRRSRCWTGK